MAMTIRDVASRANVSVATVSRIINNKGGYSKKTEERVRQAIEAISFQRNFSAHSLAVNRTQSLGVVIPNLGTDVLNGIIDGVEESAFANDYTILLVHSDMRKSNFKVSIQRILDRNVDGIIFLSESLDEEVSELLHQRKVPYIVTTTHTGNRNVSFPYIKIDDYQAGFDIANYLVQECGYRHVLCVGGVEDDQITTIPRLMGIKDALKVNGLSLSDSQIFCGDFSYDFAKSIADSLVPQCSNQTAIICLSDDNALGVLNRLREHQISVPHQVGISGFDDTKISLMSSPKITTVHQPLKKIGNRAFEKLHAFLMNGERIETEIVKHRIVVRQSTRKIDSINID